VTEKRMLRAPEIAKRMGVTRQYAARIIRRLPGAKFMHYTFELHREVWAVEEQAFEQWRAAVWCPGLTGRTEM
jgi:DNA-binding MarR family transcriptional regulator